MNEKNGFVIVETIVVIVFVLGLITFLFYNVLPLIGDYERISKYDDISSKYDAHLIRKMLLKDDSCKLQNILSMPVGKTYNHFQGKEICLYLENKNYCERLLSKDFLDIKEIIITDYITTNLKNNTENLFDRELTDYINQLPKFNNTSVANYHYKKRILVIFNNGKASNIEILKTQDSSCGLIPGCI